MKPYGSFLWHYRRRLVICIVIAIILVFLCVYWFGNVRKNLKVFKTRQFTTTLYSNTDFPFMAFIYIQYDDGSSGYCGGTLVDDKHILTAAHCLTDASDIGVILGSRNLFAEKPYKLHLSINKSIIHEDYNSNSYDNDIALLQLDEIVELNEHVDVVSLAIEEKIPNMEEAFAVLGWSLFNSLLGLNDKLLIKNISIVDNEACFSFFGTEGFAIDDSKIICALSEQGPCHSDSGGPLLLGEAQIGVLSVGDENCIPNTPVRYMNVGYYWIWIQDNMGKLVTEDYINQRMMYE